MSVEKLKSKNIWTSLLKEDVKNEIFCPPDLCVSLDEFFTVFKEQIIENRIPAEAEMSEVYWDSSDVKQRRIIVKYTGSDANNTNNIMTFLIGLDTMGNYTYVEEKIFIECPSLPKFPGAKMNSILGPDFNISLFVICLLFWVIPGLLYLIYFLVKNSEANRINDEVTKHNAMIDEEQNAWNNAWNNWEKNCLNAAYLTTTNDIFGRFTRAVSSTVKLTIKSVFEDRKAEIKGRKEKEYTEQQLKLELEKRKSEFK